MPRNSRNKFSQLKNILDNLHTQRAKYNQEFIRRELIKHHPFFKTFEEMPLDEEQQQAVVTNEDHTLVITGAGSGKTKSEWNYRHEKLRPVVEDLMFSSMITASTGNTMLLINALLETIEENRFLDLLLTFRKKLKAPTKPPASENPLF